jgi:hypothetical protein
VGQVELGRIMFVHDQPKPALEYTIQGVAAVAVTFVNPADASSDPAHVARIACDGADPIVQTPVVATQPDGVHVEVSNPTDQTLSFSIGPDIGSPDAAVSALAPGTVDLVLTNAPGPMSFSCSPPLEEGQAGVSGLGSFEVVDPVGNYVPADLECVVGSAYGSGAAQPAGGGGGASGFAGDPVQVVRDHVSGLEFDDLVERAGYLGTEVPVIRIVRAGAIVGKITLSGDGSGGWLLSSIEGCGGTQFGWSEEPTGVSGPMGPTGSDEQRLCESIDDGLPELTGRGLDFSWPCLLVSSRERVSIRFMNEDVGIPRNVSVFAMTPCLEDAIAAEEAPACNEDLGNPIFRGEIVEGPTTIVYEVGQLRPGRYYFQDDVHPSANGVLIVR